MIAANRHQFNLVFSFDSLVHADLDAISNYLPQIVQLLLPGGMAFVHHSNLAAFPGKSFGFRSEDVSGEIVRELVLNAGGRLLVQEQVCWGESVLSDCFSLFCRAADYASFEPQNITDDGRLFAAEGQLARERFQFYLNFRGRHPLCG